MAGFKDFNLSLGVPQSLFYICRVPESFCKVESFVPVIEDEEEEDSFLGGFHS